MQCSIGVTLFVFFRQQKIKVQFVTQRCTAPRISGATSSAEMHNVLDPKDTSKTWPEGVLRGVVPRRACKVEDVESVSSLWFAARSFLALSCMAMTMHTDESLALFSQPCRLLRYHECLLVTSVLVSSSNDSFASVLQTFLGVLESFATGICLCTWHECHYSSRSSHTNYHVTVSPRTHEQLRDKRLCAVLSPMVHGVAHGWRHILHFRNVCTECIPAVSSHSRNSVLLAAATVRSTDPPAVWTSTHITVRGVLAKAS